MSDPQALPEGWKTQLNKAARRQAATGRRLAAAHAADLDAKTDKERQVELIREILSSGGSTGSPVDDIMVMFTGSLATGDVHERLTWLQRQIDANAGKLVLVIDGMQGSWSLGVLPETRACLGHSYANLCVTIPVVASCCAQGLHKDALGLITWLPINIHFDKIKSCEINRGLKDRKYSADTFEVLFGTEAIRTRLENMTELSAYSIWVQSRVLGHPLEPSPDLARAIRDRREERIVDLIEAMDDLRDEMELLQEYQSDPRAGLESRRLIKTHTPSGVKLDWGLDHDIADFLADLQSLVKSAIVELEMGDNPTLIKAVELIVQATELIKPAEEEEAEEAKGTHWPSSGCGS